METKTLDDKTIRKYLLGRASEGEQSNVELWLMSEGSACDQLTAMEDELIDESLAGELKGEELEQFHSYFLAAPERVRKLQLSRSFHQVVGSGNVAAPQSIEASRGFWAGVADLFQARPALCYAMSALILVVAVGSVAEFVQMRQNLSSTQSQLTDSRATIERLNAEVQAKTAVKSPGTVTLAALVYRLEPSNVVRSAGSKQLEISVTSSGQQVEFHLAVPADDTSDSYQLTLLNGDLASTLNISGLAAKKSAQGREVTVPLSEALLPTGELTLTLTGHSNAPSVEPVPLKYHFTVVRQ